VKSGFFLNVVVRESAAVLELLARENQTLLLRGNALLVLDLGLDVLDGVVCFYVESDRFTGQGLDENLHRTTTKSQHQVKSGLLLNVVVRESAAVLELLACENQTLLLRGNALLVLDLSLDVLNGVVSFHIERDCLSRKGLDEDLHSSSAKSENEVESGLLLDVIVA